MLSSLPLAYLGEENKLPPISALENANNTSNNATLPEMRFHPFRMDETLNQTMNTQRQLPIPQNNVINNVPHYTTLGMEGRAMRMDTNDALPMFQNADPKHSVNNYRVATKNEDNKKLTNGFVRNIEPIGLSSMMYQGSQHNELGLNNTGMASPRHQENTLQAAKSTINRYPIRPVLDGNILPLNQLPSPVQSIPVLSSITDNDGMQQGYEHKSLNLLPFVDLPSIHQQQSMHQQQPLHQQQQQSMHQQQPPMNSFYKPQGLPYKDLDNQSFYNSSPGSMSNMSTMSTKTSNTQMTEPYERFNMQENSAYNNHYAQYDPNSKTFIDPKPYVPLRNNSTTSIEKRRKRYRRKWDEIDRGYQCNYQGICTKAYGTLNHLNSHIIKQRHGPKRMPQEFRVHVSNNPEPFEHRCHDE